MTMTKKDIRRLSLEDLRLFFTEQGQQPFRANQVYQWLWQKGVHNFEEMTISLWKLERSFKSISSSITSVLIKCSAVVTGP